MADRPSPTPVAVIIGTAILSLITGYMLGMGSSLGFFQLPFLQSASPSTGPRTRTGNYDDEEESSEEEIDGVLLDHAPNWANGEAADRRDGLRISDKEKRELVKGSVGEGGMNEKKTEEKMAEEKPAWADSKEECKMVLVVRTDLGMTKGTFLRSPIFFSYPRSSASNSSQKTEQTYGHRHGNRHKWR